MTSRTAGRERGSGAQNPLPEVVDNEDHALPGITGIMVDRVGGREIVRSSTCISLVPHVSDEACKALLMAILSQAVLAVRVPVTAVVTDWTSS